MKNFLYPPDIFSNNQVFLIHQGNSTGVVAAVLQVADPLKQNL